MKQRMLAGLLIVAILIAMFPAAVYAAEPETVYETAYAVNPEYAGLVGEEFYLPTTEEQGLFLAEDLPVCETLAEAGSVLREGMVNRQESIQVKYQLAYDGEQYMREIANEAFRHNGVPNEGDYLYKHYLGWTASASRTGKIATITYTLQYLSDAQQESAVDVAVDAVLDELNVYGSSVYTKCSAVYGWLTDNITYDHDNVGTNLAHTAYAGIINRTCVCQGYASLFYRMMLELGVDCRIITGDSDGDGKTDHGWDIVRIGDYYYNVDATWDAGRNPYSWFLQGAGGAFDMRHIRESKFATAEFMEAYPVPENAFDICGGLHSWGEPELKWAEDEAPEATFICSNCGEIMQVDTYVDYEIIQNPTCTTDGSALYVISACYLPEYTAGGEGPDWTSEETITLPATGHVGTTFTDNGDGTHDFACAYCSQVFTEEHEYENNICISCGNERHVHSYTTTVTEPTCTEKGYTTYTCKTCENSYVDDYVDALGHTEAAIPEKPATCTEAGMTEGKQCIICGETLTEQKEIPAHGHSYQTEVTAPTCTEKGYTTHTCRICGNSYQNSETSAHGHSFTNYIYNHDAQIDKDGTETAVCDYGCGAKDSRIKIGTAIANPFTDVAPGKFYYQPVLWAVEQGVTSGMTKTTFAPDATCTRGQVVTFLWRAAGQPEPTSTNNPFTDVALGKFYYKAVLWAVEKGITSGMTKTTFEPNAPCTRGQVVTFQWRAAGKPEPTSTNNPFTDVLAGKFYSKAVLWAVEAGITSGMTRTTFAPEHVCTRGQIVTFLYRQYR